MSGRERVIAFPGVSPAEQPYLQHTVGGQRHMALQKSLAGGLHTRVVPMVKATASLGTAPAKTTVAPASSQVVQRQDLIMVFLFSYYAKTPFLTASGVEAPLPC